MAATRQDAIRALDGYKSKGCDVDSTNETQVRLYMQLRSSMKRATPDTFLAKHHNFLEGGKNVSSMGAGFETQ